ncbi:hypothetical protein [Microvirga sp. GCM10011540]
MSQSRPPFNIFNLLFRSCQNNELGFGRFRSSFRLFPGRDVAEAALQAHR